jgi:protein involved in polysaccharide export with SLBB domain
MTLYNAIQAAGGETPFGAINRVKLFRNGSVYTYDLRIDQHKTVKIYEKDMIDVPQTGWNGK